MLSKLLLTFLLLLPSSVWATDYWVSTTGSDANACGAVDSTEAEPPTDPGTYKATVNSARACMSGGDRLIAKDGTLSGTGQYLTSIPGGTSGNPTVFRAENITWPPSVEIIMDGAQGVGVQLSDDPYVTFQGLKLNGKFNTIQPMRINGASHNVVLDRVDLTNENLQDRSCILTQSVGGIYPNNNEIVDSRIHHCGTSRFQHGLYWAGGSGLHIHRSEIDHHSGWGLNMYTSPTDMVIENNKIHDNCTGTGSCSQVLLANDRHKFRYNLVYRTDEALAESHCLSTVEGDTADATEIDNNTFYDCSVFHAIRLGPSDTNLKVRNNLIINAGGAIDDDATGSTLTTNRTTGSITDCTVSTSDLTQKLTGSACENAGTAIGLPANGSPDIGCCELFTATGGTVTGNDASVQLDMALNTPVASLTAANFTVDNGRTVTGVQLVGSSIVKVTFDGAACTAPQTWNVTYAAGTLRDSILIGNSINQKGKSFGPITMTNNCAGAAYTLTQTNGLFTEALNPQDTNKRLYGVSPGGQLGIHIGWKATVAAPPTITTKWQCSIDDAAWADIPDAFTAGNCPNVRFVGQSGFSGMDNHAKTLTVERVTSSFGTTKFGAVRRCATGCIVPSLALAQDNDAVEAAIVEFDTDTTSGTVYYFRLVLSDGTVLAYDAGSRPSITIQTPSSSGFAELWDLLMLTFLPVLGRIEVNTQKPLNNFTVGFPNIDQVTLEGVNCTKLQTTGSGTKRTVTCVH